VSARKSGSNSVVECQLPKLDVAGSIPVSRSNFFTLTTLAPRSRLAQFPQDPWRHLDRPPEMHLVEIARIGRFFQAKKKCPGRPAPLLEQCDKACHRLHRSLGADGKEEIATLKRLVDAIELVRLLAKPADVRAQERSAAAARQVTSGIGFPVGKAGPAAIRGAAALKQLAVNVNHLRRSRGLVQTVHVLGAQQEVAGQRSLEFRQGKMRRVRLGPGSGPAAIRVVVPDQLRVALPRLDVRQLVMAVPTP